MSAEHHLARAQELYERSVFGDDHAALPAADRELDAVEADLALARGRVVHARFLRDRVEDPVELPLFSRAAQLYQHAKLPVHAAVAENLWPELATTSRPSRSIEAARERGSIRADFDAEELKARRDRVLRLLREA